ncbi:unnamed protein product [Symbiodinium sp. CCMP2592]|nr:unnamed protein product [Symbiodinium sp. CCMP2592]
MSIFANPLVGAGVSQMHTRSGNFYRQLLGPPMTCSSSITTCGQQAFCTTVRVSWPEWSYISTTRVFHFLIVTHLTCTLCHAETGWLVTTDYASNFSPDSGNIALLPAEFHGPPDARVAFLAMAGISQAAKRVNEHVFACYLLLYALACEQRILPDTMAEAAFCRFQPAKCIDIVRNLTWRLSINGLLSHDLPVETMVDPALLLQAL